MYYMSFRVDTMVGQSYDRLSDRQIANIKCFNIFEVK